MLAEPRKSQYTVISKNQTQYACNNELKQFLEEYSSLDQDYLMDLTIEQALQKGVAAHKEGQLQDAERLYRAILQSQPEHPDANHNLGVLAVSVNKADAALPLFKSALEANPKIEQFWLSYIDALIIEQQFDNARRVVEQAKKQGMGGDKLNSLEAKVSSKSQKSNTAAVNPTQELLNSLLGHYQSGRLSDAEKLALHITQDFPKHPFAWKVLGAVLRATGKKLEAADVNQTAIELSPKDAQAHSNFGNALQDLGRIDEAEASFRKAITLNPNFTEAHSNLGNTLKELGKLEEAEVSYSQAIALNPKFALAHSNLGVTLREQGRIDEAEASFRQAIALEPNLAEAHNNLGITLIELKKLDEAEKFLKEAIALRPNYAEAHSNLGNTLKELGKLEEAEASFTQAIALKADYAEALYNRSQLLFDRAEYEASLRDAEACSLPQAGELILISLNALGRVNEVYDRIEKQSKEEPENLRLAAFAAFIANVEGKPTPNNFCSNPIDFIHVANISHHVDDADIFVKDIIDELKKIETSWEPKGKTTVSGFQSLDNINLFENPTEKVGQLQSVIIAEIEAYYLKFQSQQCSYIKKFPVVRRLLGWTVTLQKEGRQRAHIHPNGWLSGVIYLKVVPSLGKDEGAIEFSLNSESYYNVSSPCFTLQPEVGDIVLFPSSLHHKTIPFTTDTDRIIVSFDLKPETT